MKQIYTIYDSKAEAYMTPFFIQQDGQALRDFKDAALNQESTISKHPEDYTLFKLGTYDETTAKIEMLKTPVSMGVAIEYTTQQLEAVN
jgi:hypothetical protein